MNHVAFDFAVPPDHPSLAGHFPGNPVVPGVLLLDEIIHRVAAACGRDVVRVERVKFSAALKPSERASAQCVVEGQRVSFRVNVLRDAGPALVAEGVTLLFGGAQP